MSEGRFFRVSGKKAPIAAAAASGWSLQPRPGGWLLATGPDGRRERVMVLEQKGRLMASLGGTLFHGELIERQRGSAGPGAGGDADLVAQFPGKVRKILIAEGARAAEGQPLVLVEAMKMEFAVKAPYAGRVTRLLVKEGQQLAPGDRLVELAPDGAGADGPTAGPGAGKP